MKKNLYLLITMLIPVSIIAQNISLQQKSNVAAPIIKPWLLTGNKGTNPSVNFLGTKDAQPLIFKVNNQQSGNIDYDFSKANTGFGYQSLKLNTSVNNTAMGYNTLAANTNGQYNVALGSFNLSANTTGLGNTAVGAVTMVSNTTGSFNTAVGENALIGNSTGEANTAVGNQTLTQNKTGHDNVAVGSLALYFNTADENTALGSNALYDNTTGTENTASGLFALYRNTTGNNNTANGSGAMFNNLTGNNNTAYGNSALYLNQFGSNLTALGYNTNVAFDNLTNATAVGFNTIVDASNTVRIGNTSVTSIGGQVGWTNFSDARVKKDIKENVPGLAFIKLLKPITYHYDVTKENQLLGNDSLNWQSKHDIEKINFTGLIAQDVDAAAKKINYDFSGVDKTGKIWGLRYSEFVVPVIKALQELNDSLQSINVKQQNQIEALQSRLDKIEERLNQIQPASTASMQSSDAIIKAGNQLSVYPNPAKNNLAVLFSTKISSAATIIVSDMQGNNVIQKSFTAVAGNNNISINLNTIMKKVYAIIFCLIIIVNITTAQWKQTMGPGAGYAARMIAG